MICRDCHRVPSKTTWGRVASLLRTSSSHLANIFRALADLHLVFESKLSEKASTPGDSEENVKSNKQNVTFTRSTKEKSEDEGDLYCPTRASDSPRQAERP